MNIDLNVVLYTLGIYAVIVVSPGPNFALVSRLALQGRFSATQGAVLGLAVAATCYAVLAMFGLSAFLSKFGSAIRIIQILGGLYLIYLGVQSWLAHEDLGSQGRNKSRILHKNQEFLHGFKTGAIVTISNPKGIAFFIGLYAVAIPLDASASTRIAVLIGGIALELIWYNLVAFFLSRPWARERYSRARKTIDRFIGSLLIIVGGKMVFDR